MSVVALAALAALTVLLKRRYRPRMDRAAEPASNLVERHLDPRPVDQPAEERAASHR